MAEEKAPTTKSSGSGSKVLKTVYPVGSFEGEGFPTITAEGTSLTSTEAKAAQEAAEANDVELVEVSE